MIAWTLPLEILGWSTVLVLAHSLRRWLGLAPLYLITGVFLAFLTIQGPLHVSMPSPFGSTVPYTVVHLAIVLTSMTLIYALEGTSRARHVVGGVLAANLALLGLKLALGAHLTPLDLDQYGRAGWAHPHVYGGLVSTFALGIDAVVIVVLYQWAYNRGLPLIGALLLALIGAMGADGLVFGSLYGSLSMGDLLSSLRANLEAGFTAAIPVGLWIQAQYRWNPDTTALNAAHRGAFALVDIRAELSRTRAALEESQAEVAHVRQVFGRYVSPDVVNEVLADVGKLQRGGEVREVTVLFLDIRGYSTLSEAMSPTEVIGLLNEFFEVMARVLHEEKGTIIEFEGDAILAVFNAPAEVPDHAARAVRAGLGMLDAVEALNEHWERTGTSAFWKAVGLPSFRIRIGVHTGTVVAGRVGSEDRMKYAVIGDTVNLAARVEGLNKVVQSSLLFTKSTRDQLGDAVEVVSKGSHLVKGRKEPVEVFTVPGQHGPDHGATGSFAAAAPRGGATR
ncbi:MAG: adenylate/guanylate cyclase domain-containing protein [Deltaproteobacteria bacterium]|nr:adenylate/guanylate cyclase domain-containing protein [Deltaproteobacteria bacterium]